MSTKIKDTFSQPEHSSCPIRVFAANEPWVFKTFKIPLSGQRMIRLAGTEAVINRVKPDQTVGLTPRSI